MCKKLIVVVVFYFICVSSKAQFDYPLFKDSITTDPDETEKLSFRFDNLNYFYNNEYFGLIPATGTLFGYQLTPEIKYQPLPNLILKGGIFLQKEFGRSKFVKVAPTFSIKYLLPKASILLGNLEGNINHGYIEPIYDHSSLIKERLEHGLQLKVFSRYYDQDFFVNWRLAKEQTDTFPEELDLGISSRIHFNDDKKLRVAVPLQMLWSHIGGQRISNTFKRRTLVNLSAGISFDYRVGEGFLQRVVLDNHFAYYNDLQPPPSAEVFPSGHGILSHLLFDLKFFDIDLRYWNGDRFFAPRGNGLFQSVSEFVNGYSERKRELLIASFIYDSQPVKNLFFNFRVSPNYDIRNKLLEYSYELYLRYRFEMLLKRF